MSKIYKDSFFLEKLEAVQLGLIDGVSFIDKFGENPSITAGIANNDIWEQGGEYTFSSTADIVSLSSSSLSDTAILIEIQGLDVDGNLQIGYAELNGQTTVSIYGNTDLTGDTLAFWRVFRMQNVTGEVSGYAAKDIVGTVYCFVGTSQTAGVPNSTADIRAIIIDGNNQTQMAIYTIPKGKTGFLYRGEVGINLASAFTGGNEFARLSYRSRRNGGVFKIKKTITLNTYGSSLYSDYRTVKDPIPELTDIIITSKEVSETGMGIWATFDILLIDNAQGVFIK